MTCRDVTELATDYMEGHLSPGARLRVRLHLFLCSMCRAYIDQLQKTRRLLRGLPLSTPPADLEARLIETAVALPPDRPG
nr:zf-HC2 domain-containing protein [Limobrevibacterium gyesilva]